MSALAVLLVACAADPGRPSSPASPSAKHLLIFYKGSRHAPASVTHSKDEARARAEEAAAKAHTAGVRFDDVASEYTEERKAAAKRADDLGTFQPSTAVPEFRAALLALRVGEISGAVETVFGFYVILRTE